MMLVMHRTWGKHGSQSSHGAGTKVLLLSLQADYNMQVVKQDKSFMKKLGEIRKIAAIF